jgi:hypothetical protein
VRDSPSVARAKAVDAVDGVTGAAAAGSGGAAAAGDGEDWRRSSTYLNYRRVQRLISAPQPKQRSEREVRLEKRVDLLRAENRKLREVLRFYLQNAPDVLPPDLSFLDTPSDADVDSDAEQAAPDSHKQEQAEQEQEQEQECEPPAPLLGESSLHHANDYHHDDDTDDEDSCDRVHVMDLSPYGQASSGPENELYPL